MLREIGRSFESVKRRFSIKPQTYDERVHEEVKVVEPQKGSSDDFDARVLAMLHTSERPYTVEDAREDELITIYMEQQLYGNGQSEPNLQKVI